MNTRVLMLSPAMQILKVISWQMAIRLIFQDKVYVLETFDEEISSPSVTWKMPAVIQLRKPMDSMKRGVKFSRINVFTRDGFKCQYCGTRKDMKQLNYDHVVPRIQGGKTEWSNISTSCYPCNDRKAGRTPEQAGMKLLKKPFRPKSLPITHLQLDRKTIPEIWKPYCQIQGVEEDRAGLFLMTGSGK